MKTPRLRISVFEMITSARTEPALPKHAAEILPLGHPSSRRTPMALAAPEPSCSASSPLYVDGSRHTTLCDSIQLASFLTQTH